MTEATCKREIELEIPAENVQKATDKVARDIARVARIPGFRPGKAPVTLVRRRFADDIQGEVVQSLVPEYLEKALDEKKLVPVTRPEVDKVEFKEGEPLRFRAIFEVLPEFELGDYKNLDDPGGRGRSGRRAGGQDARGDARARRDVRSGRRPRGAGRRLRADQTERRAGGRRRAGARRTTFCATSAPKRRSGASPKICAARIAGRDAGSSKSRYPDDYPDPKLAGKTYNYTVEVQGIKEKKLPELNDEFAKDAAARAKPAAGGIATLDELRKKIRENLDAREGTAASGAGARKNSRRAREAARFPRARSADRGPDGYAPRARGAVARGAGRRSAGGECGLGIAAAQAARRAR